MRLKSLLSNKLKYSLSTISSGAKGTTGTGGGKGPGTGAWLPPLELLPQFWKAKPTKPIDTIHKKNAAMDLLDLV